jgi:hypothetical protein
MSATLQTNKAAMGGGSFFLVSNGVCKAIFIAFEVDNSLY